MTKSAKKQGFTLIEMMVSITVFMLVMTVAASALLTVIDANRKAQSIKTAVNNLNFVLEGVTKDMRMGSDYKWSADCINNFRNDSDANGVSCIRYVGPTGTKRFTIKFTPANVTTGTLGKLSRCEETAPFGPGPCSDPNFEDLTSESADIKSVAFYTTGLANPCSGPTQPMITMTIAGSAGKKENTTTSFTLQTSATERNQEACK